MKIYTDIDYVLHDYTRCFLEVALNHFKITRPPKNVKFIYGKHFSPISAYIEAFDMSDDLVEYLIPLANEIDGFIPTQYFKYIRKFILKRISSGDEVIAVTARRTRSNAEKIVEECFGKKIPVITVDTPYKHLVVEDSSIYFEDHPKAIEGVLRNRKNVTIIVPKWPWNIDMEKNSSVIYLDDQNFINLEKIIKNKTNRKNICKISAH